MTKVAVIGAGITGITTAYELINKGFDVTVFDKNHYPSMGTSYANGGQLSACNAEVWNNSSTILKGLKWIFNTNAPLLLNLSPSIHKYSWLAEFIYNIKNYEQNTIRTVELALQARDNLFKIAKDENIKFDLEKCGILHVYKNKKSLKHAVSLNSLLEKGGLHRKYIPASNLLNIEKTLPDDLIGGIFTDSDATGDIFKFTQGLAKVCEAKGVKFEYNAYVQRINQFNSAINIIWKQNNWIDISQFNKVVICAGVYSHQLAKQLGDKLNIYPVKGYSITVNLNNKQSQDAAPWVSLLDDDAKIVTSRLGIDRLRVAGTAEFNGYNYDIKADRIKPLVEWTNTFFPTINTSQVIPWAGLRPMTPSMLPKVGPSKTPNVYYNTGHGHLGWTLSAATAEIVGNYVYNT